MQFFEKPLDQLTVADIQWLIDNEVREGQTFELKSALSADKGTIEPWTSGDNKIGRIAVAALVRELVSFANSQGGTLVLGVAEGGERPARATAVTPVRAAIQLAERLKRTCPDNFDPPVYGFEIAGIETEEDGSGVVVMRIPASPYGPHRSRADKECYVRRNDEAMSIGMDEIQRRVIEMSRRSQTIDDYFITLRISDAEMPVMAGPPTWLMRIVAIPLGQFYMPDMWGRKGVKPNFRDITVRPPTGVNYRTAFPFPHPDWRPIVQGMQTSTGANNWYGKVRLKSDGLIQFDWRRVYSGRPYVMAVAWFTGMFANVLLSIERMRLSAKMSAVEYGIELNLGIAGTGFRTSGFELLDYGDGGLGWADLGGVFQRGRELLGRYPVGSRAGFDTITRVFETDVYHLAGIGAPEDHSFDFAAALEELDKELA